MDVSLVAQSLVKILAIVVGLLSLGAVLTWMERRQSAMIQDRVGPVRAKIGPFRAFGLFHPLADGLKMLFKEDIVPPNADRLLHSIAPILAFFPAIVTFAIIPFGPDVCLNRLGATDTGQAFCAGFDRHLSLQVADLNVGILFLFAIGGTGVIGAALAGAASDNKYSLLGGLRAASQMLSYEVTLGLAIVGPLMVFGTLRLPAMIGWQQAHGWGIWRQPLAFVLFFAAAIAETKRVPFDLPEGESELVGGYMTEYSGMKFGMFFLGEFVEIAVASAVIATLFFGGYDVPGLHRDGFGFLTLPHGVVVALEILSFGFKVLALSWLQLMIRWTVPRFRYDQVMRLGWRTLLPLSLANIVVTGVLMLAWPAYAA